MKERKSVRFLWFLALTVAAFIGMILVMPQSAATPATSSETTWSIALAGDALMTRPVRCFENDARFMGLVKPIREADAALINLETQIFRVWEFKGFPQMENGGNWIVGPPEMADDLKWMGFDMYNRANNHTTDWGVEGFIVTNQLLESLSLVHAGTGMTAGEAAQAKYFETQKGRFALVCLSTSFTPMSRSGEPRSEIKGRPGLNALRIDSTISLAPAQFAELRNTIKLIGGRVPDSEKEPIRFGTTTAVPGAENKTTYKLNARDEDRILRSIRNAAKQADYVVVHAHSHDIAGPTELSPAPKHLQDFIKKCLDAGADMYTITGPHKMRGIEIYKGKPIFYSLGNFFFQNETIDPMPDDFYESLELGNDALAADLMDKRFGYDYETGKATKGTATDTAYYESVLAVPTFRGDKVVEIKLYPVDMGFTMPRGQKGTSRLADPALSKKIIDYMIKASDLYGTKITYRDGIGIWELGSGGAK